MRKVAGRKVDLFLPKERTPRGGDLVLRGIETRGSGKGRGAEGDSDVSVGVGADLPEGRGQKVTTGTGRRAALEKGTDLVVGLDLALRGGKGTGPEVPLKSVGKWTIRKRSRNRLRRLIRTVKPGKTRAIAGNPV